MLEKGFLGPIGDDLPSLIPLLFALLIFFSTFSFSFSVFNEENISFDVDLAVLNISRILKGTSYVTGYSDFLDKCSSINITSVNYRAGITNLFTAPNFYPEGVENPIDPTDLPRSYEVEFFLGETGEKFECTNIPPGVTPDFSDLTDPALGEYFQFKNVITKIYPIVVEDKKVVKPMHLVVVAWR